MFNPNMGQMMKRPLPQAGGLGGQQQPQQNVWGNMRQAAAAAPQPPPLQAPLEDPSTANEMQQQMGRFNQQAMQQRPPIRPQQVMQQPMQQRPMQQGKQPINKGALDMQRQMNFAQQQVGRMAGRNRGRMG